MHILFICRSKVGFDQNISPIVKNQGDSLVKNGHQVDYYLVGKGVVGYVQLVVGLRRLLKTNRYDIIHAHYSITSIFTTLAIPGRKLVVSLMGSDTERKGLMLFFIKIFSRYCWSKVIVKTERMKIRFNSERITVLPNGVDFDHFSILPKNEALAAVGFSADKINILFLADSTRKEKNVGLARDAVSLLHDHSVVLHEIYPVSHKMVPYYLNAADVLVLPSLYEGSVNIVKEGMACCTPIVSTDVGDVRENISTAAGCFIANGHSADFSKKIKEAILFGKKTDGREHIKHLNSCAIAERLVLVYKSVLKS